MIWYSRNSPLLGEAESLPRYLKIPQHSDLNSKTKTKKKTARASFGKKQLYNWYLSWQPKFFSDRVHTSASKQSLNMMHGFCGMLRCGSQWLVTAVSDTVVVSTWQGDEVCRWTLDHHTVSKRRAPSDAVPHPRKTETWIAQLRR